MYHQDLELFCPKNSSIVSAMKLQKLHCCMNTEDFIHILKEKGLARIMEEATTEIPETLVEMPATAPPQTRHQISPRNKPTKENIMKNK